MDVPRQLSEEDDGLLLANSLLEDLEVKVPQGHPGGHRNGFPMEVVLEHGSLTTRCPGATPMGPLAQSALVDEDDGTPFFFGFFLMAGQVLRFQSSMVSGFRSRARPAGRWGLQFNCRRIFQTCPEW